MASRSKKLIKTFGLADGLKFYWHIKFKKHGWFNSSRYGRFYLRPDTTDYDTFEQVFLQDQYKISLDFSPQTIIDAGANIGLASIYFAHHYPKARIIAIEPSSENCEIIRKNVSALPQVAVLEKGLWHSDTYLKIVNQQVDKNSFMFEETTTPDEGIAAISIKSIMQQYSLSTIDILKIDIEGSEKELFEKNYREWLPMTRVLVVELHDSMKKGSSKSVFKAVSEYDFSFSMCGENVVFRNESGVRGPGSGDDSFL